jgi:FMN reductase
MSYTAQRQASIVVIAAGVSDPSSTQMLADRIATKSVEALAGLGVAAMVTVVPVASLAGDVVTATVGGLRSAELNAAIEAIASADAIVAATPVYKAGLSGLFKSFIDILDNDIMIAKPVVLAVTAGSPRHALVVEDQLRPLFAYLRALAVPTAIAATPEDWAQPDLGVRIARAATELAHIVNSGLAGAIADATWADHRHEYAGVATRSADGAINLESSLMKLAAGGTLTKPA